MRRSAISASSKVLPDRHINLSSRRFGRHCATIAVAVFLFCLLSFFTGPTRANSTQTTDPIAPSEWDVQQSELCTAALRQAEQHYHLPHALLESIGKAESGRPITSLADVRAWPWTIDADGNGLFLESKAAAIAWMRSQASKYSFVDVGCMQVDLHYHPDAFASIEDAFDPAANANYAARLLLDLYRGEASGSWDVAVGLYHSQTPILAAQYRDRVALIGSAVLHGVLRGVPLYVRAIRQGTLRLALGGGKVALINVHRQPAIRSRHPFTACQIAHVLGSYLNSGRRSGGCVEASR